MKKKCNGLLVIILFSILSIFSQSAFGQIKIKWEESSSLAQKIVFDVPEGKALLVFEGKEDFRFDSDNENINQPKKDGLLYKLLVDIEPSSGAITIQHEGAENAFINYGKLNDIGSLPALKNKEIKYFNLSLVKSLDYFDITNQKKKEGATDFQGLTEKDALIILYTQPQSLELQVVGPTTKVVQEDGRYKIYVMPEVRKINLKSKNYDDTSIDLENLTSKEVRYFRVQLPLSNIDAESFDPNITVGNYLIETNPAGALIQMKGNPFFDNQKLKTPYTIKGLKSGTEIITLDLDRYESICDTILISSTKGKKSKYNLIPKFAFLNCNIEPAIPTAKILLDGKELVGIVDGKDFECLKGTHNVEISAPHFYSQTKQISFAAGQSVELNIKLRPKMGTLSVLSGVNAEGADVFINDKNRGKIPLANLSLQEGRYKMRFNKPDFISEQQIYEIDVFENKQAKFDDLRMVNEKKVRIVTEPVTDATVYIDDIQLSDKTNLSVKLGLGKHVIKIEHVNYKPILTEITVNQENNDFNFRLEELDYRVSFKTKPTSSNLFVDGVLKGETPIDVNLPFGYHDIKIQNDGYLNVKKTISVSAPMQVKTKLFSNSYYMLGGDYGLDQFRVTLASMQHRVYFGVGAGFNIDGKSVKKEQLKMENVEVVDRNLYTKEYGRYYPNKSDTSISVNVKVGYNIITRPVNVIFNVGYSIMQTDRFQNVFEATHDYVGESSNTVVRKGDLFSDPYLQRKVYHAFTAGIIMPIFQTFYLSSDYFSDSSIGPGFSFGLGIMIK